MVCMANFLASFGSASSHFDNIRLKLSANCYLIMKFLPSQLHRQEKLSWSFISNTKSTITINVLQICRQVAELGVAAPR